jgi:hypothetical protein
LVKDEVGEKGDGMNAISKSNGTTFLGLSLILVYGVFTRLLFGLQALDDFLGVLTIGFIFFVPVALGAVTMAVLPAKYKTEWVWGIFLPWLTCLVVVGVIGLLGFELVVCIILALPIFLPLSSLGGLAFVFLTREFQKDKVPPALSVTLFLLLPYLVTLVEHQFPTPDSIRTVDSQIVINAPAEVVWAQITSVPKIQPAEHHLAAFWLLGIPKPVQAMLPSGGGVGTVRHSTYENGLNFNEVVTAWQPQQGYRFTIDLDAAHPPPWPWTQIGGPYFDLLDGVYRLEPLADGRVVLHLSSRHRLSTKFNAYGGFWTDFLLGDIQAYILQVIKQRAEEVSPPLISSVMKNREKSPDNIK